MVNSGITTGTLLWAWEIYGPRLKPIQLKIPETGNGTPDILNEVALEPGMDAEDAGQ